MQDFNLVKIEKSNINILKNLFQLYVHDISYYLTWEVNSSGEFEAYSLDEWIENKNNFGYLIYSENNICGFVMVDKEFKVLSEGFNLSEIFILNSYKGKGLASKVLRYLFDEFKSDWEVRPVYKSKVAEEFWKKFFDGYDKESKLIEWKEDRFAYTFSSK